MKIVSFLQLLFLTLMLSLNSILKSLILSLFLEKLHVPVGMLPEKALIKFLENQILLSINRLLEFVVLCIIHHTI